MSDSAHERIVLLNRIVSRSVTTAPELHKPETHGLEELLDILNSRRSKGHAIEYLGGLDDDDDDKRKKNGSGYDFVRLRQYRIDEIDGQRYAIMLVEFVDQNSRSFPVVDVESFKGRELSGENEERGATSAHIVARLPDPDGYDDGSYRCIVEYAPPITRAMVERFLSRQLRRAASAGDWNFSVFVPGKKGAQKEKKYKYHPKLQLLSDFGRKLNATKGRTLTHVVFTKRQTKQSAGKPTDVEHRDFVADVEFRVSAKQAPEDPAEKQGLFSSVRQHYETLGFETRYYFRNAGGGTVSGELNKAVERAADIMMCQREMITMGSPRKTWVSTIDKKLVESMRDLLDKDELCQRAEG
jgi:hypothetical protein